MIDTKALRSKVLDLAIHGKLTQQLESDGTAEELCQQIQEEKKELIKEGKIKKEKALPPIKDDEIPFDIPDNWKWCRLSDIGSTNIGLTYHPCDIKEKGTLVIRSSNIQNGKMDYSDRVFVNCSIKDNQYLQKNDIIICARNGSKALVGKNAIYDGESNKVAFGAFMAVFRTSIYFYTYYYFNTQVFKRYFSNDDSKQINQVTQSILKESVIPLPPLAEQKRIVERVEEIFKLLDIIDEAQKKYSADAEILKSKLITMGIQGKLTKQLESDETAEELYQQIQEEKQKLIKEGKIKKEKALQPVADEEIPFEIPKNWKWVRLGNICSKITSGSTPKGGKKGGAYTEEGFCFFREQNIYNNGIHTNGMAYISEKLLNERENSTVISKDILLNITGGSIGRCAIIPDNFTKGSINQHILIIRLINTELRHFIHAIICSEYGQSHIKNNTVGDKDGFSGGRCKNMPIPLPPLAEQKRIADTLDEVLRVIG